MILFVRQMILFVRQMILFEHFNGITPQGTAPANTHIEAEQWTLNKPHIAIEYLRDEKGITGVIHLPNIGGCGKGEKQ